MALPLTTGSWTSVASAAKTDAPGQVKLVVHGPTQESPVENLKKEVSTGVNGFIAKIKDRLSTSYEATKEEAAGVYDFIKNDEVNEKLILARYAMILRNIGGVTFGALLAYTFAENLKHPLFATEVIGPPLNSPSTAGALVLLAGVPVFYAFARRAPGR